MTPRTEQPGPDESGTGTVRIYTLFDGDLYGEVSHYAAIIDGQFYPVEAIDRERGEGTDPFVGEWRWYNSPDGGVLVLGSAQDWENL